MRTLSGLFVVFISPALFAQSVDEKKATIAYITKLQQPDGGYTLTAAPLTSSTMPVSSLLATSAALRAIKYFGGDWPNAKKTSAFVLSCYDAKTGTFRDTPQGKPDVMVTAVGMMAAAEIVPAFDFSPSTKYLLANAKSFEERRLAVAGMEASKKFPKDVTEWLDEVKKSASAGGTFGSKTNMPRETGSVVAMVLRSGGDFATEQRATIIRALQDTQRSDGAYGMGDVQTSDLETTYRVMRTYHLLKAQPRDTKAMREFIAKCRNADGGYGVVPGKPSAVNSTYYAGIILNWLAK